jgi:hypothetical protein
MHYLSLGPNSPPPPPLLSRHTNHKLTNITPLTLSTSKHNSPIDSRIACLYYKTTQTHEKHKQKIKYQYFLSHYIRFHIMEFISHYARLFKYSNLTSDHNFFFFISNNDVVEKLSYT